ncbi:ATP-dependent protease LonB [Carboxydochorda subterranea]|uniref:endopeptidase La n=1 Tax=Carboxydichorda subterranea TaxID=3109565 RepID=A0ABZ1BZG5_9FIRM|nr:ATP-dependent protease LonB [Limnochorda sp. L945t]WRP18167.1 ATP-dependent protease LonB [Limnochorda sp. L945t]
MDLVALFALVNLFFAAVTGLYFFNLLRAQQVNRSAIDREARKELERLRKLRSNSLTQPLAERTRPTSFEEVVGQEEGVRALRAALCGPNPQHVIIYGPPGVGKTAAARLVLEEAKRNPLSPFKPDARFVEVDATASRFDDRGIADPLLGSVHDPIYQGAGPMGIAGIPQPKPGAVTKAHGGVLFIDELGELHPIQLNRLLKVLEDRKVFFESAYYSSEDSNIPPHIHDIFQNGLPADFRLIGATTRLPEEISPAIRSRCIEIFFKPLTPDDVARIATNAAQKIGLPLEPGAVEVVRRYASNGREAVNMVQVAAGLVVSEGRDRIARADLEWVVNHSQLTPRPDVQVRHEPQVGCVYGLAVWGPNAGMVVEIEATAAPAAGPGTGRLTVTGVTEEEEMTGVGRTVRRKSLAMSSVQVLATVLEAHFGVHVRDYDVHLNFPGGAPVDGPSAGAAMALAAYSAITGRAVQPAVAITGELSVRGLLKPVGGIVPKVEAARRAGIRSVIIPRENHLEIFGYAEGIEVVPAVTMQDVLDRALEPAPREALTACSGAG